MPVSVSHDSHLHVSVGAVMSSSPVPVAIWPVQVSAVTEAGRLTGEHSSDEQLCLLQADATHLRLSGALM